MKVSKTAAILCLFNFFVALTIQSQPLTGRINHDISEHLERAYALEKEKRFDDAIVEYNRALQIDPTNHMAYYNLSLIYSNLKQFDRAIAIADKALENCTEDLADIYCLKATCLADMKRYMEALPVYHQALLLNPDNANLQYNLGYTYFMLKQWESAVIYLTAFIEQRDDESGNYTDALFYIGTSYNGLKKYKEAIMYFDQAIERNNYYSYYYNKAEALSRMNREHEAILVLNEAIASYPKEAILFHKRYQIYKSIGQIEKANNDLKKAETLDPNNADILQDVGVMYKINNQMQQAMTYFRKCISLKENVTGAYVNIANIYSTNEALSDSAIYYYQQAIFESPKEASLYFNFGNFYLNAKQFDKAIDLYLKAIALDSNLSEPYNNLAVSYAEKKETAKAIACLLLADRKFPNDFSINALLASIYFDEANYTNTIDYATKALIIAPKGSKYRDLLNKRGVSRQILGEYKNALYDYLEILEGYSEKDKKVNAGIYSNIGYCYFEDNQLPNALKYFKQAVNYKPEIDQLIGLLTVQYIQNDKEGFNSTLKKAKALEPKLNNGYQGIIKLESEGYFYTEKHKEVLKKIFK